MQVGGTYNEDFTAKRELYITDPDFLQGTYHLQKFQKFAQNFIGVNTNNKRLIVIAATGTGKTLIGILFAEAWRAWRETIPGLKSHIYIIGPKVSIRRFIDELIDRGGNLANNKPTDTENIYVTNVERKRLFELRALVRGNNPGPYIQEYNKLNKLIRHRIESKGYSFFSNQSFNNVQIMPGKFDNSLFIVDEFHHLGNDNEYNKHYSEMIESSKNVTQIGLTATIMSNEPEDIVGAFNIMRKRDEQIKIGDVFASKSTLADGGLEHLMREIRGEYLFLRDRSIEHFPSQEFVGDIPRDSAILDGKTYKIKRTRIISIDMSEAQYRAYLSEYTGKMNKSTVKNIINMVLPRESGGYIINNVESAISASSLSFLSKNGIEYYKRGGEMYITGSFLRKNVVAKWSTKFYTLITMLEAISGTPHDGHVYIFSSFVHNYGTKMISELLRRNGYYEYGCGEQYHNDLRHYNTGITFGEWKRSGRDVSTFIPATFLTYYSDYDDNTRQRLIETFSSADNKDYHIIKIFIGSDLTRESIHFNFIRHVFVMNYQDNFSRLQQIIGRAVRYNSHSLLPPERRNVKIYQFAAAIPKKYRGNGPINLSAEQIEIAKNEESFILITKIERKLEQEAINKLPNFAGKWPHNFTNLSYKLFVKDMAIFDAMTCIKHIFKSTVLADANVLVDIVAEMTGILDDFVILAINKMLSSGDEIVGQNGIRGRLIADDGRILFQPTSLPSDVDLNLRATTITEGSTIGSQQGINNIFYELAEKQNEYLVDPIKLYNRVTHNGLAQLDIYLARLDMSESVVIVEFAIREYRKSYLGNTKLRQYVFNILKFFKRYLIDEKQISEYFNNSNYDKYFDSLSFDKPDNLKLFVGHFITRIPRIYDEKKNAFVEIDPEHIFVKKRKTKRQMIEHPFVVGFLDRDNNNNIVFKIKFTDIKSSDKRKESRGFVCSQMNSKEKLIGIYERLGIKIPRDVRTTKVKNICDNLEREMRLLQEKSIRDGENVQFFIDYTP